MIYKDSNVYLTYSNSILFFQKWVDISQNYSLKIAFTRV